MAKHLVEIDEDALEDAKRELGTSTIKDTRVERGELARAGISDPEVGYSARSASAWNDSPQRWNCSP